MPNEVEITITASDMTGPAFASALGKMTAMRAAVNALSKDMAGVSFGNLFDVSKLDAGLMALKSKLNSLGIADIADINIQPGRILTQLQMLKRLIQQAGISDMLDFNVNDANLAKQLSRIGSLTETIPVRFDVGSIPIVGPFSNITEKFSILGLDAAAQQLAATKDQTDLLAASFAKLETVKDSLSGDIDTKLTPAVNRGGAGIGAWGGILAGTIGGVGLWHVALDGAIESLIAVGSAAAAAALGIAAMAPAAQDIYTHLQAVSTVNSALGSQIPPLTGQFDALAQAMAPQTIEAYGGALNLVNHNTGVLSMVAGEVVTMFDDWIAKIDIWANSQKGFGTILQNGVGFLSQFGHILGDVGLALGNLIKDDPGTAHFLLDIIGGAASLLDVITKLPQPVITFGLALHSMYLWGNVAGGLLDKLPGKFGLVGKAVLAVASNPATVALGAVALGLARSWDTASPQIQKDINGINSALSNMSVSQGMLAIPSFIEQLNKDLAGTNVSSVLQSWKGWGSTFQEVGDKIQYVGHEFSQTVSGSFLHQLGAVGDILKAVVDPGFAATGAAAIQMQHNIGQVDGEISKLFGSYVTLGTATGNLIKQGYSLNQAWALLDLAGVRSSDSMVLINQKVANLKTGYENLQTQGVQLGSSVDAVTFAALQQQSKVAQLNSGWDAFISTITGGESGLLTYAADLNTMSSNAKVAGASFGGLNSQSITLTQSFQTSITDANAYADKLTTLASASGGGADATNLLNKGIRDMVAQMLPAAKNSSTLTTELYALAQRGGYTGADSFQALSKWVGNTQKPMTDLNSITNTLTRSAGSLTTDVQALSTALGTTLNDAMANVIFTEKGGLVPMENLYKAIATTGVNSNTTRNDAFALANQFYSLTGSVNAAHNEFDTFAVRALGLTKSQADTLWQETLPKLQQTINNLHGKNVSISANASGSGTITYAEQIAGQRSNGFLEWHALGGLAGSGGGRPNSTDNILAMLTKGEAVVPTWLVPRLAPLLKAYGLPGFSSGGLVGDQLGTWMGDGSANFMYKGMQAGLKAAEDHLNQMWNAYASGHSYGGPGGGNPAANYALAQKLYAPYAGTPVMAAWNNVAMAESGWNQYAINPSSGAYGIPQALPYTKMPKAGWPNWAGGSSNPTAQITWMWDYMAQTYGGPIGAWQHEQAYHWYDNGGWLKPGPNYMWNGTGRSEHLANVTDGMNVCLEVTSGGASAFEQFMLEAIRNWVRIKGGGDVQRALGRN